MLKHGIFLKIYACFLITIILVIAIQISLDTFEESGPFNAIKLLREASLRSYGEVALAANQAGKSDIVDQLAANLKEAQGLEIYILDHSGIQLDRKPVPVETAIFAKQTIASGKAMSIRSGNKSYFTYPLKAINGKSYVVVGTQSQNNFFPVPSLGAPWFTLRVLIILIISGLVCFLFTRYLVSPILVLSGATKRLADGDLSVRIGTKVGNREDETTALAHDFDLMAERIETLMNLQRQLIGDISHELRSPLARLSIALDLARQKKHLEYDHALDRIEEEAQELNNMIGELLLLTRLECGNHVVDMASLNIVELVREVAIDGNFEAQGSDRGVVLNECEDLELRGNRELLRRAIENVVRNAINYTATDTEVEITISRCNDLVQIEIRDYGTGVPENDLENIFRPFYRTSQSRQRQSGGTGLGLSITERAILLHQGTVTAENAAGGGLLVTITLPIILNKMAV